MPSSYLLSGRLEDILVLIQVLASDHRFQIESERMSNDLQSNPRSAENWAAVAQDHPEFFRVSGKGRALSLVIRYASRDKVGERAPVKNMIKPLMETAINIHERHVRRHEQNLQVWSLMFAGLASLASFITILLNALLRKN
jgi:hypothetical protein